MALAPGLAARLVGLSVSAADRSGRNNLQSRIANVIGGPAGGVAAALVTGKRGLIPEDDQRRPAGRGDLPRRLHLGPPHGAGSRNGILVVRAVLVALPHARAHLPGQEMGCTCGDGRGGSPTMCSPASEIATERSLIMTLVLLGAMLADRPALSMRNLAISSHAVLLLEPESF